jgi:hypothetical protein
VDNTLQSTALSARNEKKVCIYTNTAAEQQLATLVISQAMIIAVIQNEH